MTDNNHDNNLNDMEIVIQEIKNQKEVILLLM